MAIRLKRSSEPGKKPSFGQLDLGELAVNTHDGKIFFKRDQEGNVSIREVGPRDEADNVYYVTINGSDSNDGKTIGDAFATIDHAAKVVPEGSTIYVKSGTHFIDNPVTVPAFVAIVGDSLRTSIIKPKNKTQDMFWVRTGSFLKDCRFVGHEAPSAAVAFPKNSGEVIYTSPYVQNCTSETSTGTGMRVDGADVEGLKSMVVDAFTQYNQGGIGIHHLNEGNTQLVSVFTICCDIAILCESGGFCSLTNSNSSFGNFGLVADGLSPAKYSGTAGSIQSTSSLIINDLTIETAPYIQNIAKFAGSDRSYTIAEATPPKIGKGVITGPTLTAEDPDLQSARTTVIAQKEVLQKAVIDYIDSTYTTLDYNESKCYRDAGLILDAVLDDMVLNSNYRSVIAARTYYTSAGIVLPSDQKAETVDGIQYLKTQTLALLTPATTAYTRVSANFDIIIDVITNGLGNLPTVSIPDPTGVLPEVQRAKTSLTLNKDYLTEEAIAYINANYPLLGYDRALCERDVGLVIDAVGFDLMFGSNFRSITAGRSYYREGAAVVTASQKTATIAAFTELKRLMIAQVTDDGGAPTTIATLMDLIINILDNGLSAVPQAYTIPSPTNYNVSYLVGYGDARDNIDANREFIKAEVTAYIDANFPNLVYDEVACQRDVDYILDALYYDLTYGGNLETSVAGKAYYSQAVLQLGSDGEKTATLDTYGFLSTLVEQIALNTDVAELQATVAQVTGGLTPSSAAAATQAGSLIDDIITYIADNSSDPVVIEPDTGWATDSLETAHAALQAAKSSIQTQITAYVEANFAYDQTICRRDLGLILDGIIYDALYKGNSQSYNVGIQYYSGGKLVIPELQRDATGDAINFLTDRAADVLRSNTVIPLQTSVLQDSTTQSTTSSEISRVQALFVVVESTIRRGYFINAFTDEADPDFASQGEPALSIRQTLLNNLEKLQVDTIKFLNTTFSEFQYDEAVCSRDVGFILDAVAMDVALGTNYNSIVAGLSYQRANVSITKVRDNQLEQTLRAIRFVKSQVAAIDGLSQTAIDRANARFDEILDIIENNTPDTIVYPSPTGVDDNLADAKDQLQNNREFIKDEIIAYINKEFQNFSYDQATCERDLGLIIDAVTLDAVLNTNYNSITAGQAYKRAYASAVVDTQLIQTTGAIRKARDIVDGFDDSSVALSVLGRERLRDNFDVVLQIIEAGDDSSALPDIELNTPASATQEQIDAKDQIRTNSDFIQEEVIAYISANYPALVYDEARCRRDVNFIIDAIGHDVLYGGNYASIIAARSYYNDDGVLQLGAGEGPATIAAYEHLKIVVGQIAQGIIIERTTGNTAIQLDRAGNASTSEVSQLEGSIDIIIDAIQNGLGGLPAVSLPDITWADEKLQSDFAIVRDQKEEITIQVIQFIESEYQDFTYDQARCERDVGYIVDALSYDILYGGNSATRTLVRSYFSFGTNQLGTGETAATILAYEHLSSVVQSIVLGQAVTPTSGNLQVQNVDSTNAAATQAEATRLGNLLDVLIGALRIETANNIESEVLPSVTWAPVDLQTAFISIITDKPTIQTATIAFINDRYRDFDYNQFKCSRDVGLIIDAVTSDVVLGTNYRSRLAGKSYYRASSAVVIDDQLYETLEAIKFVKAEALKLIDDVSTAATTEYNAVIARFDDILNILENGESVAPAIAYNAPVGATQDQIEAKDILQANRQFFIEEAVGFISENFPLLGYDRALCERDVGLVIDAVGYDLMFGSNFRSITAGRSYYREGAAVVTESQKAATVAAFEKVKELAVAAVTDATAQQRIEDNLDIIIDILNNGLSAVPSFYTIPDPTDYNTTYLTGYGTARDNIDANRNFIIEEVTQYIADNSNLVGDYDQAKCERDAGLILDAVALDLVTGSTYNSTYAGIAYTRANSSYVIEKQDAATILAIEYLRDQVKALGGVDATADTQVDTLFGIVTNAIQNGTQSVSEPGDGTIAALVFDTAITEPTTGAVEAHTRLQANRTFLGNEVNAYISTNFPGLTYDATKCARDVRYIVDGLSFDILYGGNVGTRLSALSYYVGTADQLGTGQEAATADAYRHLGQILRELVVVAQGSTSVTSQVSGGTVDASGAAATSTEADALWVAAPEDGLVKEVIRVIEDNGTQNLATEVQPDSAQYTGTNTASYTAARTAIITDKTTLVNATITYINENLKYDEAACRRDLDYILDAIYYDLTYGGNLETSVAGKAYYSQAVLQLGSAAEKTATLDAYGYLSTLVEQVALDVDIAELQTTETQILSGNAAPAAAATQAGALIDDIITYIADNSSDPVVVEPELTWVASNLVTAYNDLQAEKTAIQTAITTFVEANFAYKEAVCRRDVGFIIDAITFDVLYGGNRETIDAGDEYFSSGTLQIPGFTRKATADTFAYLKQIAADAVLNVSISPLQTAETQNTSLPAASSTEADRVTELLGIVVDLLEHGYSSTITFDTRLLNPRPKINEAVTFHQPSLITASGHTFEWVGSGVNINSALPYQGGQPISAQQVIETNDGKVFFTSTDQKGDFKIGNNLTIERATGTITGDTFDRSLFAVLTPYILSLEG